MAVDAPWQLARGTWSDSSARAVLQLMVESVAAMVDFEVAALSVVVGEELVTVAYAGPEEHRAFLEESDPVAIIEPVLARAAVLGPRVRFLEGTPLEQLEGHWVRLEQVPSDHPDAWQADDGLLAVLRDDDQAVVGILSVDRPSSGRRPDARRLDLLERYAAQAERAVLTLVESQALLEQAAHAESARRMVRSASRPTLGSLEDVLRQTHGQLVSSFAACGSWLHVLRPDGPGTSVARRDTGAHVEVSADLVDALERTAPRLWAGQVPLVLTGTATAGDDAADTGELTTTIRRDLLRHPDQPVLGVALGVGEECVGFMVLTREIGHHPWSAVDIASAQEIGHDLGAALMTARALERERGMVAALQRMDDYRTRVVAMLSHELRTPLTVISGNLELLADADLDPAARRQHEAMARGTERMRIVVDDLLLLARVSNPDHPLVRLPVDLRAVAGEVATWVEATARSAGVTLHVDLGPDPLTVAGDTVELDRLVGNLVSNAVKYTGAGGTVTVAVHRVGGDVVLSVADTGLGISEQDQRGLFTAFFRSSNPDALRESGTGLGLATVATIVERHGGRVEVASRLGEGSTFTVRLPAA